jgi:preprotein translocase subunit SecD
MVQYVLADENVIAFRLAYESEKPDTFVAVDKHVGKLFVQNVPILTTKDVSKARVIIDDTEPPEWLSLAAKASGAIIRKPQVQIAFTFTASAREIFSRITAENIQNRIAIFINNELVMAPQIMESIDSEEVLILKRKRKQ